MSESRCCSRNPNFDDPLTFFQYLPIGTRCGKCLSALMSFVFVSGYHITTMLLIMSKLEVSISSSVNCPSVDQYRHRGFQEGFHISLIH